MKLSEKLQEYLGVVKERIENPVKTLAEAIKEAMPTEENPLGGFGMTGIARVPKMLTQAGTLTSRIARTDRGEIFREVEGGKWIGREGDTYSQEALLKKYPTAYPIPTKRGPVQEGDWSQIDAGKSSFVDTRRIKSEIK